MRTQFGPSNPPTRCEETTATKPLTENKLLTLFDFYESKEISDRLLDQGLDLHYMHISKIATTILHISYFYFDYKNYKEVVDNLEKDMYNLKYINSLIIAFFVEYDMVFRDVDGLNGMVVEYESEEELENAPIVKIIKCISEYVKEKDIQFYPWE
jgi:hypothetical protein